MKLRHLVGYLLQCMGAGALLGVAVLIARTIGGF